jgi:hypothetical protein
MEGMPRVITSTNLFAAALLNPRMEPFVLIKADTGKKESPISRKALI